MHRDWGRHPKAKRPMSMRYSGGGSESRDALPQEKVSDDDSWRYLQDDDRINSDPTVLLAGFLGEATSLIENHIDDRFAVLEKKLNGISKTLRLMVELDQARSDFYDAETEQIRKKLKRGGK